MILVWWLRGCAAVSAAVVVFIGLFVMREAWPGVRDVGLSRFIADDGWYPTAASARYGMLPMVAASLWLMVCGNVVRMPGPLPGGLFDPVRALTSNIALEMAYAMQDHRAVLFVSGAVLLGVVLLVAAAEWFSRGDPRHVVEAARG